MAFTLDERVRKTYLSLRVGVATLGIALPLLLLVGGSAAGIPWQPSMSAYYHATPQAPGPSLEPCPVAGTPAGLPAGTMRNVFVGILFAVGAMLYVNKGFSKRENWALNIAGVTAFGIALFPMSWCESASRFSLHGTFALAFFASILFVCEFCSSQTLRWLRDDVQRRRFRNAYHAIAVLMAVSPLAAFVANLTGSGQSHFIFFAEAFGILSFVIFWLVKSYEIRLISRQLVTGSDAAHSIPRAA